MVRFETMKVSVLLFGITRDIIGDRQVEVDLPEKAGVNVLKRVLIDHYPGLRQLDSMAVAVNNEYVRNDQPLHEKDEIALIPPVSGG